VTDSETGSTVTPALATGSEQTPALIGMGAAQEVAAAHVAATLAVAALHDAKGYDLDAGLLCEASNPRVCFDMRDPFMGPTLIW